MVTCSAVRDSSQRAANIELKSEPLRYESLTFSSYVLVTLSSVRVPSQRGVKI